MQTITLLLPGLIWPFNQLEVEEVPRFQALDILLSRSNKFITDTDSFYHTLCDQFGLEASEGRDLPLAALSRLIDDAGHPQGYWLRADPVYLETVRDGLRLIDSTGFSLSQHDAILIGSMLKKLFDEQAWHFEIPDSNRWYLQLEQDPGLSTTDISKVRGLDVQLYMPSGNGKTTMERLMTEIQMTLHDCDFNLEREKTGQRPINSVWFWGGGYLPEVLPRKWSHLTANDPVAHGLAILSGTPFSTVQDSYDDLNIDPDQAGDYLLVYDELQSNISYQDYYGWLECLKKLEENYFIPLLDALKNQQLQRVTICTGNREFELDNSCLKKIWRRVKPLSTYCK